MFAEGKVALPTESGLQPTLQYLKSAEQYVANKAKVQQYRDLLLNPPSIEQPLEAVSGQTSP